MNETPSTDRLRLYLIRHGEVEGAERGKVLGWTDISLSDAGRAQADKLAEELAQVPLAAIHSSDLQRAIATAEAISRAQQLEVKVSAVWREINMGKWEGRTTASLHEEFPELVRRLFAAPASFQYPEGESFGAFVARVQRALNGLLQEHSSGSIALVTHGGVCRTIIGNALGMAAENWLRIAQDYGCVNIIDWYELTPVVRVINWTGPHPTTDSPAES